MIYRIIAILSVIYTFVLAGNGGRQQNMYYILPDSLDLSADNTTSTVVNNVMAMFQFTPYFVTNTTLVISASAAVLNPDGAVSNENPNDYVDLAEVSFPFEDVTGLTYGYPFIPLKTTDNLSAGSKVAISFTTNTTDPQFSGFTFSHNLIIKENCGGVIIEPCTDASGKATTLPPQGTFIETFEAFISNPNSGTQSNIGFIMQPNKLEDFLTQTTDTYDLYYNGSSYDIFETDQRDVLPQNLVSNTQKCLNAFVPNADYNETQKISKYSLQFNFDTMYLALAVRRRSNVTSDQLVQSCNGIRVVVYPTANNTAKCSKPLVSRTCDVSLSTTQWIAITIIFVLVLVVTLLLLALILMRDRYNGAKLERKTEGDEEKTRLRKLKSKSDFTSLSNSSLEDKSRSASNLWYLQQTPQMSPTAKSATLPSSKTFKSTSSIELLSSPRK